MKILKLEVGYVYTVTVSSMRKRASVVEHRNVGGSTPVRSTQSSFCPSTPLLAIYRIISSFIKLKKRYKGKNAFGRCRVNKIFYFPLTAVIRGLRLFSIQISYH